MVSTRTRKNSPLQRLVTPPRRLRALRRPVATGYGAGSNTLTTLTPVVPEISADEPNGATQDALPQDTSLSTLTTPQGIHPIADAMVSTHADVQLASMHGGTVTMPLAECADHQDVTSSEDEVEVQLSMESERPTQTPPTNIGEEEGWETVSSRSTASKKQDSFGAGEKPGGRAEETGGLPRRRSPVMSPVISNASNRFTLLPIEPVSRQEEDEEPERGSSEARASPYSSHISYATPEVPTPSRDLLIDIIDSLSDGTREMLVKRMRSVAVDDDDDDDSSRYETSSEDEIESISVNATRLASPLQIREPSDEVKPSNPSSSRSSKSIASWRAGNLLPAPTMHSEPRRSPGMLSVNSGYSPSASLSPRPSVQRASSQIPAGSYLASIISGGSQTPSQSLSSRNASQSSSRPTPSDHRRHSEPVAESAHSAGDPSDDSSSSSSESTRSHRSRVSSTSSESSNDSRDTKERKRLKKKLRRLQKRKDAEELAEFSRHVKCPEPSAYDGSPNFEKYNQFVFEAQTWIDMSKIPKQHHVASLKRFLTGDAGKWYMQWVAPKIQTFDLATLFQQMFDYFFPPDFRRRMRDRFANCTQGSSRSTRDFARYVRLLATRLGDIDDREMRVRFWNGSQSYLRVKWSEAGYDPETSSMDELEEAAERFEQAHRQQLIEEGRRTDRKSKGKDKESDPNPRDRDRRERRHGRPHGKRGKSPSDRPRPNRKQRDWKGPSREERNELRAQGKCFICKESGHTQKDCPKKNESRKPNIGAATVDLHELEALVLERDSLKCSAISPFEPTGHPESLESDNAELTISVLTRLENGGPYGVHRPVAGPRFRMRRDLSEEVYLLTDRCLHNVGTLIDVQMMSDPLWDPVEWYIGIVRGLDPDPDWAKSEPNPSDLTESMWDRWNMLLWRIATAAPYPGDDDVPPNWTTAATRFSRFFFDPMELHIVDEFTGDSITVTRQQAFDPDYDVGAHYRLQRVRAWEYFNKCSWTDLDTKSSTNLGMDIDSSSGLSLEGDNGPLNEFGNDTANTAFIEDSSSLPDVEMASVTSDEILLPTDLNAQAHPTWDESTTEEETSGPSPVIIENIPEHTRTTRRAEPDDDIPSLPSVTANRLERNNAVVILPRTVADAALPGDQGGQDTPNPVVHLMATTRGRLSPGEKRIPDINGLERNSIKPKDFDRLVPRPIVINIRINGREARALLDTGSLADFMSTRLADQLKVPLEVLAKPLGVQMAAVGSRSMVFATTTVDFEYQSVKSKRRFDIMNLDNYDMILGTPFIYQHKVVLGLNPTQVGIGSPVALPIRGEQIGKIPSKTAQLVDDQLQVLRNQLLREAADLCKGVAETDLPPLRAVNHEIPLLDESKVYPWRPSRCPEALKPLWHAKRNEYLKSGRWRVATGSNASPLLILKKKPGPKGEQRIRTVVDKRAQNANTRKMASPLPDIETILRNVASHKYRSIMDGKDAYEQIRIKPQHVGRTLFTTPDGTMESLVLQQGDCNGGATYQALMNHIFAPYIGKFMDVYLDDIVIYSDTIEEHLEHVRIVLDILRKEKLFLSADKMHFFTEKMNLLGHVITDSGIQIDPHKVESIANWKTPTNKDLLAGFIGTVGFVARGCKNIRIPMAVLTPLTGTKVWNWGPTEQRAFDEIRQVVQAHRDIHTRPISDDPSAGPINLTTDASLTGGGGALSQGEDLAKANYVAFWSGKFTAAQQNYATHERELLAVIESLKRFQHVLIGRQFRLFTDHKALKWFDTQKDLSHRQLRWSKFMQGFDYEVHYLPGPKNVIGDALSRMYSHEEAGTVRAVSEMLSNDSDSEDEEGRTMLFRPATSAPVYTGAEVLANLAVSLEPRQEPSDNDDGPQLRRSSRNRRAVIPWVNQSDARPAAPEPKPRSPRKHDARVSSEGPLKIRIRIPPKLSTITEHSVQRTENAKPARNEGINPIEHPANLPQVGSTECLAPPGEPAPQHPNPSAPPKPPPSPHDETIAPAIPPVARAETQQTAPLLDVVSRAEMDVLEMAKGNYAFDKFFSLVLAEPERYGNFVKDNGLIYLREVDDLRLGIPDAITGGRRLREILISQAHSILAHLGASKTFSYLREHVWWPKMRSDVDAFCESCPTCATSKSRTQHPYGLLKSLPVPSRPWQSIGIDFVGPLPISKTRNGEFDMICVIIDHLTAMVHLVATKQTYRAKQIAEVIFDTVYKLHGLPERIISDRDSLFTSTFWRTLHSLLGVDLRLSSAFHPQTDGATERANRTLTQMLRQCVSPNQTDWAQKLPAIEFALNSARSETTGFSPFYLNYGRLPYPMIWESESKYPGVRVLAERMKDAILTAHDSIIEARVLQTQAANRSRMPAPFKVDELVYVSTKNMRIPKQRARKLMPKYIGPVKVLRVITEGASYLLDLPADLKQRGIHPVFHASLLRPHVPNDDRRFPGRQLEQFVGFNDHPKEWAVEAITTHSGKGRNSLFRVRWKSGDETWEEYRSVAHLEPLKAYCEAMGVESPEKLPSSKSQLTVAVSEFEIQVNSTRFTHEIGIPSASTPSRPSTAPHGRSANRPQRPTTAQRSHPRALPSSRRGMTSNPNLSGFAPTFSPQVPTITDVNQAAAQQLFEASRAARSDLSSSLSFHRERDQDNTKFMTDLIRSREEQLDRLRDDVRTKDVEIARLRVELDASKIRDTEHQAEIGRLKSKIDNQRTEIARLVGNHARGKGTGNRIGSRSLEDIETARGRDSLNDHRRGSYRYDTGSFRAGRGRGRRRFSPGYNRTRSRSPDSVTSGRSSVRRSRTPTSRRRSASPNSQGRPNLTGIYGPKPQITSDLEDVPDPMVLDPAPGQAFNNVDDASREHTPTRTDTNLPVAPFSGATAYNMRESSPANSTHSSVTQGSRATASRAATPAPGGQNGGEMGDSNPVLGSCTLRAILRRLFDLRIPDSDRSRQRLEDRRLRRELRSSERRISLARRDRDQNERSTSLVFSSRTSLFRSVRLAQRAGRANVGSVAD